MQIETFYTGPFTVDSELVRKLAKAFAAIQTDLNLASSAERIAWYEAQGYDFARGSVPGVTNRSGGGKVHSLTATFIVERATGRAIVEHAFAVCGSRRFGTGTRIMPHGTAITCSKCAPAPKPAPECEHCGWDSHATADCPEATVDAREAACEACIAKRERFQVGDLIRAWDFEPMPGRRDRYVEGVVKAINDDGTLSVHVVADTAFPLGARFEIRTPVRLFITEFPGRLALISTYAEREAAVDRADNDEDNRLDEGDRRDDRDHEARYNYFGEEYRQAAGLPDGFGS